MRRLREHMLEDMRSRFKVPMSKLYNIATCLDPRTKVLSVWKFTQPHIISAWAQVRAQLDRVITDLVHAGMYHTLGEEGKSVSTSNGGGEGGEERRGGVLEGFFAEEVEVAEEHNRTYLLHAIASSNNPDFQHVLFADEHAMNAAVAGRKDKRTRGVEKLNYPLEVRKELLTYLVVDAIPLGKDPLEWWRSYAKQLPALSRLAMEYLSIPGTSAGVERSFSKAGNVVTRYVRSYTKQQATYACIH